MPNSNTRSIQVGSEDNTLIATVYNNDGSIKADLAHNTTGISIFVQRIGEANGSALTLSAKATPQTAHADGAFLNLGGGDISIDCPDAPFATYKGRARIYGTFDGGTIIGEWFDVVGFDTSAVALGANTTTPTNLSAAQVRTELATELARIDATISSRSTFAGGAVASVTGAVGSVNSPVTVGTNNDKTGYSLTQAFPSNFASLGITGNGDIIRVALVDTTTANTDMRGTDNALLASSYTAPANGDIAAIKAKTDNLPNDPAGVSDVSPTINFNPTIEPTPVTVNPTEISSGSVDLIRDGLATIAKQEEILLAVSNISVELSPEDIEEISDAVSTAVSEDLVEEVEREGGMLQRLLSKFDGIDKLIRWIRQ